MGDAFVISCIASLIFIFSSQNQLCYAIYYYFINTYCFIIIYCFIVSYECEYLMLVCKYYIMHCV